MPISAADIRTHEYQFSIETATGTWRWTTRMDVTASTPSYQVRDVITPFGTLRDNTPIPGEVVEDMAASIDQIKSNFPPSILVGPPTSLTFDVDEGRGFSTAQNAILTNNGVFGSLLGASLASSASYVSVTPGAIGNLAANETGTFAVAVNSTDLLAANSPYGETVTIQDSNAANTPQSLPVTINVRPKATIQVTPTTLNFSAVRPISGSFAAVPSQTFEIQNAGPANSVLSWQGQMLTGLATSWLSSFSPVSGTLASGETQTVTVALVPSDGLAQGTYEETIRVSGYSDNEFVDLLVQFVVS